MNDKYRKQLRLLGKIGFYIYVVSIFYFVLLSERYGRFSHEEYRYNLVLFQEIKRFITYHHHFTFEELATNLFGNVFAFSPYGMLLPFVRKQQTKLFDVLRETFCFSLVIESMQLIFKVGVFDVDDLLMNTVGGLIGYFCYFMIRRIVNGKKRQL